MWVFLMNMNIEHAHTLISRFVRQKWAFQQDKQMSFNKTKAFIILPPTVVYNIHIYVFKINTRIHFRFDTLKMQAPGT